MTESEQRQYPRYETEIGMTIYTKDEKMSGAVIDMGRHGFGLVSEKELQSGSQVMISLNYLGEYAINGIVKWSSQNEHDQNIVYRLGIEVESIIWTDLRDFGFPEWDELVEKIVSESEKPESKD